MLIFDGNCRVALTRGLRAHNRLLCNNKLRSNNCALRLKWQFIFIKLSQLKPGLWYLATYTTILKKQDRDYYWGVKVAHVAETSKANNGHHTSYPSPPDRAIVTGVECAWQRLTGAMSLLLVSFWFISVLCVSGAKIYYRFYVILILAIPQGFAIWTFELRSFRALSKNAIFKEAKCQLDR